MTSDNREPDDFYDDPETLRMLMERQEELRRLLSRDGIAHIEITIVDDHVDTMSPLKELAITFESLVNALLGNYATLGDTKALALLQGLNSLIHNHSHTTFEIFMADLAKKTKMSPNSNPMEILEKLMNQLDSEDESKSTGTSPIPDTFLKAFEESEDE